MAPVLVLSWLSHGPNAPCVGATTNHACPIPSCAPNKCLGPQLHDCWDQNVRCQGIPAFNACIPALQPNCTERNTCSDYTERNSYGTIKHSSQCQGRKHAGNTTLYSNLEGETEHSRVACIPLCPSIAIQPMQVRGQGVRCTVLVHSKMTMDEVGLLFGTPRVR